MFNGTMDNLLIDREVMLDSQRGKRDLSMAWIDVRKAYDSVDHDWLCTMTAYTGFPYGWVRLLASCVRVGILE